MTYSRDENWQDCCQHQQQIAILQQKLMEIHNKLIDQLDICKEQQLKIISLIQSNSTSQNFDTFNYQSFGHAPILQQNQNSFNSMENDSRQSHITKNQLLQADLQAMRNKVLAEITQKNRVKEDLKELRGNHKRNMQMQTKRYEALENLHNKMQEEYQHLNHKYDKIKKSYRSESELDRLTQILADVQTKYSHQRENNLHLQAKCRDLEEKLAEIQSSNSNRFQGRESKLSSDSNPSQQRQIQFLKTQIERINHKVEKTTSDFRPKESRPKRRGFEETKDLIKKLQETQQVMRRNRRAVV